jgi:predicted transcriptional regulator
MKVVLSIKPEFAEKIFNGTKQFEFRKVMFKNQNVTTVIVYASSPVQQVIGEFEIEEILSHDIDTLWDLTQTFSGITAEYFYKYFENRRVGFAIKIKETKKFEQPKCLRADYNLLPPQSFSYYI